MIGAPARGNVETPSGPLTGGMVRYLPDFDDYGHHVAFQLDPPRHQYACFLETLYDVRGPIIVQGGDDPDLPCE